VENEKFKPLLLAPPQFHPTVYDFFLQLTIKYKLFEY